MNETEERKRSRREGNVGRKEGLQRVECAQQRTVVANAGESETISSERKDIHTWKIPWVTGSV